ncbi:MAG: aminotransferase class V-fold PLP-dependent enzyme [Verrucomicrobia bacterium]|nr:aminotransferase class V-fold PLP-dependent enzyme [Verrucomicrobiota bacterium]
MLSNRFGIMARSGFHCAQPLHEACGLAETVRISVHFYNTVDEIESLVTAVGILARMS